MGRILKWVVIDLLVVIAVVLGVLGVQYFGGQPMGFFSGSTPTKLGFNDGKFAAHSTKPNWVSSTVDAADSHYIAPFVVADFVSKFDIPAESRATVAYTTLRNLVLESSGATEKKSATGYLYAEFKTPGLGFVDDLEIALDTKANVIHVKSGSRLGIRDFDLNRKRVEALRVLFKKS